jgi:hypothetical protein
VILPSRAPENRCQTPQRFNGQSVSHTISLKALR